MTDVLITCPTLGLPVVTGVRMASSAVAAASGSGYQFACASCGSLHDWDLEDGFVAA